MSGLRWDDLTSPDLRALAAEPATVVVIPIGSIEQHGPHLPVSTDAHCAEQLALRAVGRLPEGAAVVAPAIRYGASEEHVGFAGTISLPSRLLEDLLVEIGVGILRSGFCRLLYVNGHGGNDRLMYYVLRTLRARATDPLAIAATTYWKVAGEELRRLRLSTEGGMGHACELETSLMLYLDPAHVHMADSARHVPAPYSPFRGRDLLAPGPLMAPDRFVDLSPTGVTGDPSVASIERGEQFTEAITTKLAEIVADVSRWDLVSGGPA